jgi:hypothetical protein
MRRASAKFTPLRETLARVRQVSRKDAEFAKALAGISAWPSQAQGIFVFLQKVHSRGFELELNIHLSSRRISTHKRFVLGGEECAAPFSSKTVVAHLADGRSPVDKGEIGLSR